MYKDKEKQREAGAERQRRYRENSKALHPAIIADINRLTTNTDGTVDEQARTNRMATARAYQRMYPDKQYTGVGIAPADIPASPVPVRVSKPGDADYNGICTEAWRAERGR